MVNRIWDKKNKYTQGFLKEYQYWALEVSYRQHTLGSYIVFCKREIEKISELTSEEILELGVVMREIENTLLNINSFKPDRFNYLQLGNNLHTLHFHGIPRYKEPRIFAGKKWTDKTWGHPPIWSKKDKPDDLVTKIRDTIKPYLS